MIDNNTDFYKIENNFLKIKGIDFFQIVKSTVDYIPKITIAIPTYRRPKLLKEAIDSALNQNILDYYDIIIVDNDPQRGCDTEVMVCNYSNPKISYYKNTINLGMINNWNRCIELSQAEWVVLLHDDDLLLPDFICECKNYINRYKEIGILKPKQYHFESGTKSLQIPISVNSGKLFANYETDNLESFIVGAPSGMLLSKEKAFRLGGFNPDFYPSSDFYFVTLFSHFYKVFILDKFLSVYRLPENTTFKLETLEAFYYNDCKFFLFLYKKFIFPKYLRDRFLAHRFTLVAEKYKKINKNFNLDISNLGLNIVNTKYTKNYYRLLSLIIFLYRVFNTCLPDKIRKRKEKYLLQTIL